MEINLDELIGRYEVTEELVEVTLPQGEILTFKPFQRKADWDKFMKTAGRWYAKLPKPGTEEESGHPFAGVLPETGGEAIDAYMISERSVSPRMSHLHALKLLRAPFIVRLIVGEIEEASKTVESLTMAKVIEESKKNFQDQDLDE